jgi:hypothetical protein
VDTKSAGILGGCLIIAALIVALVPHATAPSPSPKPMEAEVGRYRAPQAVKGQPPPKAQWWEQLPVAQYPEVAPPTVQVSAIYPGANAQVVADTVATPIEQEVNGVENMLYMSSTCTNDGQMNLNVTFAALPPLSASTVGLMGAPLGEGPLLAASALFPGRTTFALGTDLNMAQVLVQNRVSVAEAKLPEEVKRGGPNKGGPNKGDAAR